MRLRLARPLHVRRGLPRRAADAIRGSGRCSHVTNGESAGNTLRQTGARRRRALLAGRLHEGPVPDVPPAELRAVRARFLSECGWGSERSLLESLERRDRLFERALEGGTDVVLWFEHDLYDQLQLLQALALAGDSRLELIQARRRTSGPLPARTELEALWPLRRPVIAAATRALAREAWEAFRAPEPTGSSSLLGRDTSALPHPRRRAAAVCWRSCPTLGPGSRAPSGSCSSRCSTGLGGRSSSSSRARRARRRRSSATPGRGSGCAGARAAGRRSCPPPPPLGDPREFLSARVTLTPLGRKVLAGKADRVEAAPDRPLARRDPRRRGLALGCGYATTSAAGPTIRLKRGTTSSTLSCAQKAMSSSSPGGP